MPFNVSGPPWVVSLDSWQTAAQALVSGAGTAAKVLRNVRVSGDSFTARTHQAFIPSGTSVSGGVLSFTSTAHGLATDCLLNITGAALEAANVIRKPITRVSANAFSVPVPGVPDGAIATGVATVQATAWSQQTLEGIFVNLQRLAGGAFVLTQNAGHSGYRMADVLARYETAIRPFAADLHIHWGYFNDCQFGVTVEASVASVQEILSRARADGAVPVCVSALPIPSGVWSWPVLIGPLVTLTDATASAWVAKWNRLMAAYCAANKMIYIDVHSPSVDVTTGYALAGFCKASDIHPSQKSNYLAARLLFSRLQSGAYVPRLLSSSTLDNVASDAANRNLCRAAPTAQGAGGTPGAGETTTYTAWVTATVVPASRWRTNAGNLYYTVAGGTTGATPPTHTTGSVSDGAVTWLYMGLASGTAGVPADWRAISGATAPATIALVSKTDGSRAVRATTFATINNDQIDLVYVGLNADYVAGDTVSFAVKGTLSAAIAASSPTLSGQNVKSVTAIVEFTAGGVTYLMYEAVGGVGAANEMQVEDLTDAVFAVDNVVIPSGAITLARFHLQVNFSGAGVVALDAGQATVVR